MATLDELWAQFNSQNNAQSAQPTYSNNDYSGSNYQSNSGYSDTQSSSLDDLWNSFNNQNKETPQKQEQPTYSAQQTAQQANGGRSYLDTATSDVTGQQMKQNYESGNIFQKAGSLLKGIDRQAGNALLSSISGFGASLFGNGSLVDKAVDKAADALGIQHDPNKNIFTEWNQARQAREQADAQAYAQMTSGDKISSAINKYGTMAWSQAPSAVLSAATAMFSAPAMATTAGLQAASSLAQSSGIQALSQMAAQGLRDQLSNPMFWTGYVREAGGAYNSALQDGASEEQAGLYANIYALFSSMIETGGADENLGGMERFPKAVREAIENHNATKATAEFIKSIGGEIGEELQQGSLENILKMGYRNDIPLYSTEDPNAIINPNQMLETARDTAITTALMQGGQHMAMQGYNAIQNRLYDAVNGDPVRQAVNGEINNRYNNESAVQAGAQLFADNAEEIMTFAQQGSILFDANGRQVGEVTARTPDGILLNVDGKPETVVLTGNSGLINPAGALATYLKNGAWFDEAQYAPQQQTEQAPQAQPTQPTQQAPQQPQAAPQQNPQPAPQPVPQPQPHTSQFQNRDVFDNTKYKIDQDPNGKLVVYDADNKPVGGTYDTYAQAVELAAQMSQNDTTQESPQNGSQSVSQEDGNSVLPNEQNVSETQNEELNSKPEPEARQKRSMTLFENESEGEENTRQVGNISYVTETDAASIDNIRASKQNYELGGERFSAEDVERMTAEDVLYRLKAWAKKLNFGGIKGFANKIGAVITSIQDTSGANYQIEKSFYDVISRTDSGNAKNKRVKKDYSNINNFDRAAYEALQSREGLQKNRADSAFMYLLERDANAKLSDALSTIVKKEPAHLQASAEHILNGIFRKAGLDMNTATVQDGIAALAESGNVNVAEVLGMSEEDIEEIFALLDRANQIEVVLNGKNLTLNEILDGTVELEESDDSTFAEKDFHGESSRKEAIDAIDEDIEGLRNAIDVLESSTGHENAIRELEKQIDALEKQKEAYLEEEQQDEREADKNYRDVSNETDILTAAEEEEADNAAVAKERGRRPELGSISRNNQPFIKKSDVPAKHLSGSAGYVRGIKYNGETYYAVSSLEKGGYRNIIPDGDVAKAKRVIQAFENAIEQQQRTVDYYLTMMRSGDTLTSTQENFLKKAQQGVFDLQRKLDIINGGTYTLQDLWNDNRVPADIKSMSPSNEDIRNRSLAAIANAVTESDAIRGIKAMEGESYGRQSALQSRTQNTQRNDATRKERTGAKTNERGTALRQTQERRDDLGKRRQDSKAVGGRKTGDHLISKKTETDAITAIRGSKTVDACSKIFSAFGYKVEQINSRLSRSFIKETVVARNGKIYVPIGESEETARLRNKISTMNRFRINQVESVIDFTYDKNGNLVGIVSYGLCKEKNGLRQIWGDRLSTWNHESSHDDFNLADIAVSERQANGETINDVEKIVGEALTRALDAVGLDYADFESDLLAREYEPDEINGELYAEFTAMMHEGTTSEWDANATIPGLSYSEAGKKLAGNKEFQNLVKTIQSYADEGYLLYESDLSNSAQSTTGNPKRATFDQYSDESFDALVNDTSYEEASAINGQNYDQYDLNSELGAEQASETETLNSMSGRGVDTTAVPIENFQNAEQESENAAMEDLSGTGVDTERTPIDYFQSQEQASESDLIREQSRNDLTDSEDTNFESPYEAEQRTEQEAMDSLYENMDGRKLTSPKRTANDYYGSAYARVQETQKKYNRNKHRSTFNNARRYYDTYGETNDSIQNFKRLQKLNSNIDSLLDGKMSIYDFNAFAKNMSTRQGIGQILNDDIQRELATVAALEEAAQGKNADEQATKDFQYAAANVVSHIVARMDMVEKTERARARLDNSARQHGAKGRKGLTGTALDWWNRMQITGDNFWRMMDDWSGEGQGYSYAREHLKSVATRISEESKLKGYFEGLNKNSKEFKDFASGKTMSNVDFDGHKISLMEGIKFVKTVDTLRMFASENGRPSWQRVASLGGFTFEGSNGKPVFVDIKGSYDNNGAARAAWVEQKYNQLKQEIANNKAASAYMAATEDMYYEASKDAERVHSKVNGYDRYMYGKGWYTDIHYAKKGDGSVDFRYSDRDATDVHDTASMQKRSKVAGGYAIINPMSRSVDAYISQISNYIAFEEFGQKLGVLSDSKSINGSYANTIRDAYGDQYAQWFDNYVKTMTLYKENKPKGGMNSALAKARQAMMSGALIGSVSVPIKQVSSFFDTMGTLDPKAVAMVFVKNPLGLKQKGIRNYLMDSRTQSISDPDLAELFRDNGILRKLKDTPVGKLAMSATNMMDATAVSNVYRACVLDTEYNNPLGKDIYKNGKNFKDGLTDLGKFYVDAKFEETLLASQPIFTPQARNEMARTDNQLLRMFSTFRTQQTQNYNRTLQTWNEYQAARRNNGDTKETGKKFVQTMTGQMIASASLAALTAIANAVLHKHNKYKDDDDEFSWEKLGKRFGLDTFESLMGNSLFVGDVTKWMIDFVNSKTDKDWDVKYSPREFYGISSGAVGTAYQIINSAVSLYSGIQSDGWTNSNKMAARYLAGNIATAFGVPANNIYSALNAGWQWYADAAGIDRKYEDLFKQWVYVDSSTPNRLYNALAKGDLETVDSILAADEENKAYSWFLYTGLERMNSGKLDREDFKRYMSAYGGASDSQIEKILKGYDSGVSQYNDKGQTNLYNQYSGMMPSKKTYDEMFDEISNRVSKKDYGYYYYTWNGQQTQAGKTSSAAIEVLTDRIRSGQLSKQAAQVIWENYYLQSVSKNGLWRYIRDA